MIIYGYLGLLAVFKTVTFMFFLVPPKELKILPPYLWFCFYGLRFFEAICSKQFAVVFYCKYIKDELASIAI